MIVYGSSCVIRISINGNLTSLHRNGLVSGELADTYELWTFGEVENVEMTYDGNQLRQVNDATGRKLSERYELYREGLPPSMELDTLAVNDPQTGWTSYYIAFGHRDYCGNYIYQNGKISMVLTPAGYISGNMRYYYLKDYQGNNCVVLNQNGVVQQINHYYPYGSLMGEGFNASSQPYRYSGKELVTLENLNLSDFGARWLDSPSGTFITMDPLCEDYNAISPYVYCGGNPVRNIDPTGCDIWKINDRGEIIEHVVNEERDQIIMVDNDGSTKIDENGNEASVTFEYGTVISQKSSKQLVGDKVVDVDIFKVRGDKNGEGLFKFLSDNVSTPEVGVEYSLFQTGVPGEKGLNFVSTSHMVAADASGSILFEYQLKYGYSIRKHIHSHPTGDIPGFSDFTFSNNITYELNQNKKNIPLFYIYYVPEKQMIKYD